MSPTWYHKNVSLSEKEGIVLSGVSSSLKLQSSNLCRLIQNSHGIGYLSRSYLTRSYPSMEKFVTFHNGDDHNCTLMFAAAAIFKVIL